MVLSAFLQVSTIMVAVLTLVWHQTRTADTLRNESRRDHQHLLKLHAKAAWRARKDNEKLWNAVIRNTRKLDRIEGFLGIGTLEPASGRAQGAALASHRRSEELPEAPENPPEEPLDTEAQMASAAVGMVDKKLCYDDLISIPNQMPQTSRGELAERCAFSAHLWLQWLSWTEHTHDEVALAGRSTYAVEAHSKGRPGAAFWSCTDEITVIVM